MQNQGTNHTIHHQSSFDFWSAFKNNLPSYHIKFLDGIHLPNLPIPELGTIAVAAVVLLISLYCSIILFSFFRNFRKKIKEKYVFLEVKPTDRTLKTPFSTSQLFTTLHSLISQESSDKRSISFELVSTREEGIRYVIRVPLDEVPSVKKILIAYVPGISVKEIPDYQSSAYSSSGRNHSLSYHTSVKDLRFKKHYLYPLKEQELLNQSDPIAYLTTHMTKLEKDELVAIQFIATPVHSLTHGSLLSFTNKIIKTKLLNNEDISDDIRKASISFLGKALDITIKVIILILSHAIVWFFSLLEWAITLGKSSSSHDWLLAKKKTKKLQELSLEKQRLFQRIYDKINQPLFEVTIRLHLYTKDKKGSDQRIKGIISSFDTFEASGQAFKPHNLKFSSVRSLLSFLNLRIKNLETFHLFQLKHRFSIFATNPILSVSELSSLYHFPNINSTNTEDLLLLKSSQLSAPLVFKQAQRELDIIFAKNTYGESETPIGQILEERRRHTYIIGASGSGKTTLLLHMIYQDILNGKGVAVLDYHGDLIHKILGIIPLKRWKDVVLVDPSDYEHPVAVNIMELKKGLKGIALSQEKGWIVSNVLSIFKRLSGDYWGPRLEHVLRNALLTALETENPTIETVYNLLMKKTFRTPIIKALSDGMLKNFWLDEFEKLKQREQMEYVIPITNKLNKFLTAEITYNMVSRSKSSIDFEDIMDNNKIFLVDLSQGKIGDDNAFFIGSLLVGKIHLTALRRVNIPEDDRVDFFLYIDEFQYFATDYFTDIFSGARKYRLDIIIAHQNTSQISDKVFESITGNAGTIISFRLTGPKDEDKMLDIFYPEVEKGQLKNLPTLAFYIKIHGTQPQDAFTGEIELFSVKPNAKTSKAIIKLSQQKHTVKIPKKNTIKTKKQNKTSVSPDEKGNTDSTDGKNNENGENDISKTKNDLEKER